MRKNVLAKELKLGDVVRMSHVQDGHYMDGTVTKVSKDGIEVTRPYIVPVITDCELNNGNEMNYRIGSESMWFSIDGNIKFDVIQESFLKF